MKIDVNASLTGFSNQTQQLSPENFAFIADLARSEAGLHIPFEKATMVASRITKQARLYGAPDLQSYCNILRDPNNREEIKHVISALTTNVTSFFREAHHFRYLVDSVIPRLIDNGRKGSKIRIWSAGCSSGQEPYSIAMSLLDRWPNIHNYDVRILATDIDLRVLKTASDGLYDLGSINTIDSKWKDTYFSKVEDTINSTSFFRISDNVKNLISFRHLNLIKNWPFKGSFDVIFCRNVVIYFHEETQKDLWRRFENACNEGGVLFVGHSERVEPEGLTSFKQVGNTTYEKLSHQA